MSYSEAVDVASTARKLAPLAYVRVTEQWHHDLPRGWQVTVALPSPLNSDRTLARYSFGPDRP